MIEDKVIAADIGGTYTEVGFIDKGYTVIDRFKYKTLPTLEENQNLIKEKADEFDGRKLSPVGISVSALLSPDRSRLIYAPNLGWTDIDLSPMADFFNRDCDFINDGNAAGLWNYLHNGEKALKSISVMLGTGVGGCVMINGEPVYGAGEIGHIILDFNGPQCSCGSRGCLESSIGANNLPARVKEWTGLDIKNTEELFRLAGEGNDKALQSWKKAGEMLGYALSDMVKLIAVEEIIIGGGVAGGAQYFSESLKKTVKQNVMSGTFDLP
ncbi:MAG: ROK family protein, partial [Elusimicrobia bacterium]|nr:ROK family protein [Elusimicrobiota bacterium]